MGPAELNQCLATAMVGSATAPRMMTPQAMRAPELQYQGLANAQPGVGQQAPPRVSIALSHRRTLAGESLAAR
jgi:hypothetical protein